MLVMLGEHFLNLFQSGLKLFRIHAVQVDLFRFHREFQDFAHTISS
jgi:hypothetical protein